METKKNDQSAVPYYDYTLFKKKPHGLHRWWGLLSYEPKKICYPENLKTLKILICLSSHASRLATDFQLAKFCSITLLKCRSKHGLFLGSTR